MRITMLAIGSRGDVQPLAALAVGLQSKGHLVRLVAGDEFASLVTSAGPEFVPLGITLQPVMETSSSVFQFMESIKGRVVQACAGEQEAIIATFLGVSACPLARARKIPFFYVLPMPGLKTREFPNPLFPGLPLGGAYNAFTYQLADGHITRSCPDAGCLFLEPRPAYLFCFSTHVVPRPADWGSYAQVTGFWFLDHPAGWRPPIEVEAFLQAGPPPVYAGFGSTRTGEPQKLAGLVIEALARAKQRGILVTGWGGLRAGALNGDVLAVDSVPFDWLFPYLAAAVHHGGAGTVSAALRAGIPSVIVPFGLDQSFWAQRVYKLGAAAKPLAPKRLTVECLAAAICSVVEDAQFRDSAARLGEKIRMEDGVGNAVAVIERVMAANASTRQV